MTTISLKVPTSTLVANAEAQRKKVLDTYAAELAEYKGNLLATRKAMAKALREAAVAVGKGERKMTFSSRYRRDSYEDTATITVEVPAKKHPQKPSVDGIDRDLRLLRATSQEEITVRADSNLARYL